ncbi:MAG TPA: phosphonate C-P lyase system protein PhnH [Candidatus Baltobacteraceae bacterium]
MRQSRESTRATLLRRACHARLAAMAHPGLTHEGPLAGGSDTAYKTAGLLAAALLDRAEDAERVAVVKGDLSPDIVAVLPVGSNASPEDGATVIAVDMRASTRARLSGPGIGEPFEAALPLDRAAIWARNKACAVQPLGVDFVFVFDDGRVTGLPRTTRVEVLE